MFDQRSCAIGSMKTLSYILPVLWLNLNVWITLTSIKFLHEWVLIVVPFM